jgi:hypothetical protein
MPLTAGKSEAPSMYEMEGAPPPAGARYPLEVPVSRSLPRSGITPGRFPFPTVKVFLLLSPPMRKSLQPFILNFSPPPRNPQDNLGYPHVTAVIHRLMHSSSTSYQASLNGH